MMDAEATDTSPSRGSPPDTRGSPSPRSTAILAAGIAAILMVLVGSAIVQAARALQGPALTPTCVAQGLTHYVPATPPAFPKGIKGAEGVCNIVEALRSGVESTLLYLAIGLGVLAIIAGFALFRAMDTRRRREQCIAGAVLGIQAVAISFFVLFFRSSGTVFSFVRNFLNFVVLRGYAHAFLNGAKNTLVLALGGEIGGLVVGLTLSLLVISSRRTVRAPARVYINFFRGTPLIFQLSFFYFLFVLGFGLHQSAYTVALIVFSLNTGAYASEVFRAGIQSIERGQMEAARSLGFSYLEAMRFAIVPQAVRRVIPPLLNEFVILIKDTALVVVLGLLASQYELYVTAQNGYSATFNATFFIATAIGYLVITLPLIGAVNAVERRLRSGLVGIAGAGG
jgi:His/Glu/Gln/Arg/opine family amino acid ABC transporter permease subunit